MTETKNITTNWVRKTSMCPDSCNPSPLLFLTLYEIKPTPSSSAGANDVDEHFRTAPFESNLPITMGLLGIWNVSFLEHSTRAILPYAQALAKLAPHIQQVPLINHSPD